MKKKIFILLVFILTATICCDHKNPLYMKTTTLLQESKLDTISKVTSDYLEVDLTEMNNKKYKGKKLLQNNYSKDNYKAIFFEIVDEKGNLLWFNNSSEFLNYISERGYEMVDKKETQYHISYTFKRK